MAVPADIPRRVCASLEADRPADALVLAETYLTGHADGADLELLGGLARRRIAHPDEPWLEALVTAWESAGKPTRFTSVDTEDWGDRLLRSASPQEAITTLLSVARPSPLHLLTATAWAGRDSADALASDALAAMRSPDADPLWLAALLSTWPLMSSEVAAHARHGLKELHSAMARAHPLDFRMVATNILDDGSARREPLSAEQVRALAEAIERHEPAMTLGGLYDRLVRGREATSAVELEGCFQDAVALLPDPLTDLVMRARINLAESALRDELLSVLSKISDAYAAAPTLLERLHSAFVRAMVADARRDAAFREAAAAELAYVRRLIRRDQRLPLDWPIEMLRREVSDALAHDEYRLWERVAYPPAAQH